MSRSRPAAPVVGGKVPRVGRRALASLGRCLVLDLLMRLDRPLLLTMVLLLATAGCDGGESDEATTSTREATAPVDDGGVEVAEAGEAPRRRLRLGLEQGQEFKTKMAVGVRMRVEIDGQPVPAPPLPRWQVLLASTVDKISGNGDISVTHVYTSIEPVAAEGVDPATLNAIRQTGSQIKGLKATVVMTPTGAYRSGTTDTSAITDPTVKTTVDALSSQLQSLTVSFPAAAVGRGATWRVKRSAAVSGVNTDLEMRYRLVDLSKDSYRLEVEQDVTAPPGPVTVPGVPPGATAHIEDYKMKSAGSISGALDRLLPRDSSLKGSSDVTTRIEAGGQSAKMLQHMDLDLALEDAA